MDNNLTTHFRTVWDYVSGQVHKNAQEKGFWNMGIENRNKGELLCLMHSELSECMEAIRKPDIVDQHLPNLDPQAVELADCVIRIMDYGHAFGLDIAEAVVLKMQFNAKRPHMHGGKKF